jgi:hypothetical protein
MTAPFGNRVRCTLFGHDWRRAIGPRQGYYLRCRRCWISEEPEIEVHAHVQHVHVEEAAVPQAWRPGELQRQA